MYSTGKKLDETITNMNNQLVNVDKTQVIIFSRRTISIPNTQAELKGQPVAYVAKTKFFGVIVDQRLNWKDQVYFVAGKLSKSCGILYKIRNCLTTSAKSFYTTALIIPF